MAPPFIRQAILSCVLSLPALIHAACQTGFTNNQIYTNANGKTYRILCDSDSDPNSFVTATGLASLDACLAQCDSTQYCTAVSYIGGACYMKKGHLAGRASTGLTTAFLYNVNKYPAPQVGSSGGSTGCGNPLPSGITPGGAIQTLYYVDPHGYNRNYLIHVPSSYQTNAPAPLIMSFHGQLSSGSAHAQESLWHNEVWNPFGISVFPTAINGTWESNPNYYPVASTVQPYDQDFVAAFVSYLQQAYCIDTTKTFASGQSNGGGFDGVMACNPTLNSVFAAFGPHCGAFYSQTPDSQCGGTAPYTIPTNNLVYANCNPGKVVPIIEIHGDNDGTISYFGGGRKGYCLPALPHWVTDWAVRNGQSATNITYPSTPVSGVTKYEFGTAGQNLGVVTHYRLAGWTHNWSLIQSGGPIDSTPIIMDFFYRMTNAAGSTFDYLSTSQSSSSMSSTTSFLSSSSSSSSASVSSFSSSISTTQVSTQSVGADGYTTVPWPPACSEISNNVYAVFDLSNTEYLYMCGGGSRGDTNIGNAVSGMNWTECLAPCDSYGQAACVGGTWNGGANFGLRDSSGNGACTLKQTAGQPTWQSTLPVNSAANNLQSTRVAFYNKARFIMAATTTTFSSSSQSSFTAITPSSLSTSSSTASSTTISSSSSSILLGSSSSTTSSAVAAVLGTTVGPDGYTTVPWNPYGPTCTDVNANIYAVTQPQNGREYLYMCGGGSQGFFLTNGIINAANWTLCMSACDSVGEDCLGGSYNGGDNYGERNAAGLGACTLKSTAAGTYVTFTSSGGAAGPLASTRVAMLVKSRVTPVSAVISSASTTSTLLLPGLSPSTTPTIGISTTISASTAIAPVPTLTSSSFTVPSLATSVPSALLSSSTSALMQTSSPLTIVLSVPTTSVLSSPMISMLSSPTISVLSLSTTSLLSAPSISASSLSLPTSTSLPLTSTISTGLPSLQPSSSLGTTILSIATSLSSVAISPSVPPSFSSIETSAPTVSVPLTLSYSPSSSFLFSSLETSLLSLPTSVAVPSTSELVSISLTSLSPTLSSILATTTSSLLAPLPTTSLSLSTSISLPTESLGMSSLTSLEPIPTTISPLSFPTLPTSLLVSNTILLTTSLSQLTVDTALTASSLPTTIELPTTVSIPSSLDLPESTSLRNSGPRQSSTSLLPTISLPISVSLPTISNLLPSFSASLSSLQVSIHLPTSDLSFSSISNPTVSDLVPSISLSTGSNLISSLTTSSPFLDTSVVATEISMPSLSTELPSLSISLTSVPPISTPTESATICQNFTTYSDMNGTQYCIYCDSDSTEGAFESQVYYSGDYTQCTLGCDAQDACTGFVWVSGATVGGTCYYKRGSPIALNGGGSGKVAGNVGICGTVPSLSLLTPSSSPMSPSTALGSSASSMVAPVTSSAEHAPSVGVSSLQGILTESTLSLPLAMSSFTQSFTISASLPTSDALSLTLNTGFQSLPFSISLGRSSASSSVTEGMSSSVSSSFTRVSPAPACATNHEDGDSTACGKNDDKVCTDPQGLAYLFQCDTHPTIYVVLEAGIQARVEPTFTSCLALCDFTSGCVAVTYLNTTDDCTMYSSVSGTGPASTAQFALRRNVYNSVPSASSSLTDQRTTVIYTTELVTITSCASSITNCPVTITSVPITTVVRGSTTGASHSTSRGPSISAPRTTVVYSTQLVTVSSCASSIPDCSAAKTPTTFITSIPITTIVGFPTSNINGSNSFILSGPSGSGTVKPTTRPPMSSRNTQPMNITSESVSTVYIFPSKCLRGTTTVFTTDKVSSCPATCSTR